MPKTFLQSRMLKLNAAFGVTPDKLAEHVEHVSLPTIYALSNGSRATCNIATVRDIALAYSSLIHLPKQDVLCYLCGFDVPTLSLAIYEANDDSLPFV